MEVQLHKQYLVPLELHQELEDFHLPSLPPISIATDEDKDH